MKRTMLYTLIAAIAIMVAVTSQGRMRHESVAARMAVDAVPSAPTPHPTVVNSVAPVAIAMPVAAPTRHSRHSTTSPQAYTLYKDPVTGGFGPPRSGTKAVPLTPEMQARVSTSGEGLVEVQSPVPNGGVMIRLDGRFMDAMTATVDASGKVTATCSRPDQAPSHVTGKE